MLLQYYSFHLSPYCLIKYASTQIFISFLSSTGFSSFSKGKRLEKRKILRGGDGDRKSKYENPFLINNNYYGLSRGTWKRNL